MLLDGGSGGGGGETVGKLIGARLKRGLPLRRTGECPQPGRLPSSCQHPCRISHHGGWSDLFSLLALSTSSWPVCRLEFLANRPMRVSKVQSSPNLTSVSSFSYRRYPAFKGPDQEINIFLPDIHAACLSYSASYVFIRSTSASHFLVCMKLTVARKAAFVPPYNSETLLYIRPLVFGSSPCIAVIAPTEFTLAIYA